MTNYPIDPSTGHAHSHGLTGNHSHTFTAPDVPLKQAHGNIPISQEMAQQMIDRDAKEAGLNHLIDEKVREAEKKLKAQLESQLWGGASISGVSDLQRGRTPQKLSGAALADKVMKDYYVPAITNELNRPSAIAAILAAQEKKDMDTKYLVEDEVAKRKAAKAKKKVKKAYKAFDALALDGNDYAVWAWSHTFDNKAGTTYEYVALFTRERWYVTGSKSVQGVDTDEFVGWLVATGFDPDTFVELA